jgi:hypothetical protein
VPWPLTQRLRYSRSRVSGEPGAVQIVSRLAFEEYLRSYVVMPPVAYSTSGGDRSGERNGIPRIQISNAGFGFAV